MKQKIGDFKILVYIKRHFKLTALIKNSVANFTVPELTTSF